MSENRNYDGPNWRDNPDEYTPPVRRKGGFLASRGYENPEIAALKFRLVDDIQRAIQRHGLSSQVKVAARLRAARVPLAQSDLSAILTGSVNACPVEQLMQVAAALGTSITVSITESKDGIGHLQVRRPGTRRRAEPPAVGQP